MATPTDAEPQHVFVINDTPEILEMFRALLREEGYRVTLDRFTVELAEMLARVKDGKPDLLILDYLFGREEQGWQFLQMLKMDRAARDIPVVVCQDGGAADRGVTGPPRRYGRRRRPQALRHRPPAGRGGEQAGGAGKGCLRRPWPRAGAR